MSKKTTDRVPLNANLRTILFLDDWPILTRQGIDRRWFAAEPWPEVEPWHDPLLDYSSVAAVRRDPQTRGWRMWGGGSTDRSKSDEGVGLTVHESSARGGTGGRGVGPR